MLLLRTLVCCVPLAFAAASLQAQQGVAWHTASESDLKALIPARAPVVKERIETEFRTASGITDGEHHFIAGVVLITAGYSAEGKYSHFLIVQAPVKVGEMLLTPGQYVFGWTHNEDSLTVNFYEAASGKSTRERGSHAQPVDQECGVLSRMAARGEIRDADRTIQLPLSNRALTDASIAASLRSSPARRRTLSS